MHELNAELKVELHVGKQYHNWCEYNRMEFKCFENNIFISHPLYVEVKKEG